MNLKKWLIKHIISFKCSNKIYFPLFSVCSFDIKEEGINKGFTSLRVLDEIVITEIFEVYS